MYGFVKLYIIGKLKLFCKFKYSMLKGRYLDINVVIISNFFLF